MNAPASPTARNVDPKIAQQENTDAREVLDNAEDHTGEGDGNQAERTARVPGNDDGEQAPRRKPIYMSPADEVRQNIAKRFKHVDEGEEVPFNGDMTDPEMLYGQHGRAEPEEPDPDAAEPGVPKPEARQEQQTERKYKLKIRNQDVEMTEAEVLAAASKVTAADSYLDESRKLLEEAKAIRGGRSPADPRHPEGETRASDDGREDPPDTNDQRRPADRLKGVVEKIQFGEPEEAAQELAEVIDEVADKRADQRQLNRLMSQDLVKSQKALKAFTERHPELAGDKIAALAIESGMYDLFREEIVALGTVDADKIPKDPAQLANWHRFHRVHGDNVSKVDDLLEKSFAKLQTWRGDKPRAEPGKSTATERAKPRVDVNVERTERRAQLPNQPSRTVSPRLPAEANAKPRDASSVIANMRRARGQMTA